MQPLRRYDSPWFDDPAQDASPPPLSPLDMPGFMSSPFVREALARSETFADANRPVQPVQADDAPLSIGDLINGIRPAPLSAPNMPAFMGSRFVREALSRSATFADVNRPVRSVRSDDAPLSIDDSLSGMRPAPLSTPKMPSIMEDPFVRAARARLPASPAAQSHIQPVRADNGPLTIGDLKSRITPVPLSAPIRPNVVGNMDTVYPIGGPKSFGAPGLAESMLPVWGPGRNAIYDFEHGHPIWGGINIGLGIADVLGLDLVRPAGQAALQGVYQGLSKGISKGLQKAGGVGEKLKQFNKSFMRGLSKELRGYWKFGSHEFDDVRAYYARYLRSIGKPLPKDLPVHHWFAPQRWERAVPGLLPKWLINQPWNLLPLTRVTETEAPTVKAFHDAIEGKGKSVFQFDKDDLLRNYRMRYEYGTPDWAKIGIPTYSMSAAGNSAEVGNAIYDYLYKNKNDQK